MRIDLNPKIIALFEPRKRKISIKMCFFIKTLKQTEFTGVSTRMKSKSNSEEVQIEPPQFHPDLFIIYWAMCFQMTVLA